jgi:hypothetical protein
MRYLKFEWLYPLKHTMGAARRAFRWCTYSPMDNKLKNRANIRRSSQILGID